MEVWFGQVDPQHAADECGALTSQPAHHVDGPHQARVQVHDSYLKYVPAKFIQKSKIKNCKNKHVF